jgi:hypothetical protein
MNRSAWGEASTWGLRRATGSPSPRQRGNGAFRPPATSEDPGAIRPFAKWAILPTRCRNEQPGGPRRAARCCAQGHRWSPGGPTCIRPASERTLGRYGDRGLAHRGILRAERWRPGHLRVHGHERTPSGATGDPSARSALADGHVDLGATPCREARRPQRRGGARDRRIGPDDPGASTVLDVGPRVDDPDDPGLGNGRSRSRRGSGEPDGDGFDVLRRSRGRLAERSGADGGRRDRLGSRIARRPEHDPRLRVG